MKHPYDEMHGAGAPPGTPGPVRAHYAAYARWLAAQPDAAMRARREEAEAGIGLRSGSRR